MPDVHHCRECDSFLAGKRADNPDLPTKPFLIPAADCTTAKIHDFALTLWFLVDGDGNLAGCGDTLDLGSMVVLQVCFYSSMLNFAPPSLCSAACRHWTHFDCRTKPQVRQASDDKPQKLSVFAIFSITYRRH